MIHGTVSKCCSIEKDTVGSIIFIFLVQLKCRVKGQNSEGSSRGHICPFVPHLVCERVVRLKFHVDNPDSLL